jgi:hypothetical protein
MTRRSVVLFWGATAAAVFFLGSAWAAAGRLSGPHAAANAAVSVIAVVGFVTTALVAGRIAFVIGRAQRRARARGACGVHLFRSHL